MKTCLVGLALVLSLVSPNFANAVDTVSDIPQIKRDADMDAARDAIQKSNWTVAIDHLHKAANRDARNADAHNLLGYSYRKSGNLNLAFKHYTDALKLDPNHRGAHEYIGEAYLLTGNLAKAEEHLKALDRICFFSCEEFRDLRSAVEDYKRAKK